MIEAAGIVVPAHDEEELLPSCLAALREAIGTAVAALPGIRVRTVVAADTCSDRTADLARLGWEAVVGTVTVADWTGHPPDVAGEFTRRYGAWRGCHPHVHGANLGFSAQAYLAAGGFPPLRTAEDHALVSAMQAQGRRVLRTPDLRVVTSARARYRAPGGFGYRLTTLSDGPGPLLGAR
jgi:hypothetical protein